MGDEMQYLIDRLKEIEDNQGNQLFKTVDMYSSQNESKMNILSYPALLIGTTRGDFDKGNRINGYERKLSVSILLFNTSVSMTKEKELQTLDLIDSVFLKFSKDHKVLFKFFEYLERTSTLTAVDIEVEVTGDSLI